MRCQVFGSPSRRLERKAAGDIDKRIEPAELRRDGVDGFFGLGRIRKIDAAEFDPIGVAAICDAP